MTGPTVSWRESRKSKVPEISPRAARNKQAFIRRGAGVPVQGRTPTDPRPGGQACSSPLGCDQPARASGCLCRAHSDRIDAIGAELAAMNAEDRKRRALGQTTWHPPESHQPTQTKENE